MRFFLRSVLVTVALAVHGLADEPFLKPNDVIALVGGEDMVAAAEYGYLELLLTRALPEHRLKFRCLAWEGDTVFEQRRDLNFPTWEAQLETIGATVVICQFGQMESLAGKEKLPEFIAAYRKLIERFAGGGTRRLMLFSPTPYEHPVHASRWRDPTPHARDLAAFAGATNILAARHGALFVNFMDQFDRAEICGALKPDGIHFGPGGHELQAALAVELIGLGSKLGSRNPAGWLKPEDEGLRRLIAYKNTLWDRYWRPQNWAFLAGDRVHVASSRDHLDPKKRWFPAEREEFLPLIEKKEQEIWAFAAQLK